ncbi:HAD-IA family hydrolase [Aeromonas salmonicida subsp. salmonicida]|uniref:HAD-IA family hydrolase n=1 Tax=Aeromonas salmonicida TaxID=645 RepID=UPI003FD6685D
MLAAVIFDMDGVLIDSEPFWQRAQMAVFSGLGHPHSEEDCNFTIGVRIDQLVAHWYRLRPWVGPSQEEVMQRILDQVIALILSEGQPKEGVLGKLGIRDRFLAVHSAEVERFGKPHPDVYIHAAEKLGVEPVHCLAIEDSFTGLPGANVASMRALIVPDPALVGDPRLAIADHQLRSLGELNAATLASWVA